MYADQIKLEKLSHLLESQSDKIFLWYICNIPQHFKNIRPINYTVIFLDASLIHAVDIL